MQKTVQKDTILKGVGVHSGAQTTLKIKPAEANTGIVFIRTDITDKSNKIEGRFDAVVETTLCTVLSNMEGVTISTVEHLLAGLRACDVDNAIIEIDGPEVPIMDGSARPFMRAVDAVGTVAQNAPRKAIRILKEVEFTDGDKVVKLSPSLGSRFEMTIDFDANVIGKQSADIDLFAEDFETEISDARTFGFLHEVEYLRSKGLARGGSLDNAVVIDGEHIMNPDGLRFENEFARHKLLDAVGDLYLAGAPIIGTYVGYKAGHATNNKILHALFADNSAYEIIELEENDKQHTGVVPFFTLPKLSEIAA